MGALQSFQQLQIDLVAHDSLPYPITVDHIEDCYKPFKV
uniref:1-deoxy-D-xylulose-5-phosphate synthase n=1 Tax=Heterorhabditis bacteriophora TaxID=37862 RepID=A0A1I7WI70_HETBA